MNSDIFIDIAIDKPPYIKRITSDRVINVTGESGSGKSTFCQQYKDDTRYILLDTDLVFSKRTDVNQEVLQARKLFAEHTTQFLINNFDCCYVKLVEYFSADDRILVIDSAQFRNIKNISLLKGKLVIIRTSINRCYQQCLRRYRKNFPDVSDEDFAQYAKRKQNMYQWYHSLNEFIKMVDAHFVG